MIRGKPGGIYINKTYPIEHIQWYHVIDLNKRIARLYCTNLVMGNILNCRSSEEAWARNGLKVNVRMA